MPSRRDLIKMEDQEIREFLDSARTLIIVSNGRDGYPHPMPMWFCVDRDGALCCTTFAKSQKVFNWRRDPRASLLVESGHVYSELKGVVIYATTEIVSEQKAVIDVMARINSKGRDLDAAETEYLRGALAKTARKRVVLRFVPERYVSWDHSKLGGSY